MFFVKKKLDIFEAKWLVEKVGEEKRENRPDHVAKK